MNGRPKVARRRPPKVEVAPDTSMIVSRGPTNIKPPTKAQIEDMKIQEFIRKKRPGTTI